MNVIYEEKEEVSECVDIPMKQHKNERYACAHTQPSWAPGFKIRQFFFGAERWSGSRKNQWSGAERWSGSFEKIWSGAERSGGAEILENFDFFGVFDELFCEKLLERDRTANSLLLTL